MSSSALTAAVEAAREGRFVALFDNEKREGETDLILPAAAATPAHIRTLRKDGGGVIFVGLAAEAADHLGLPFLEDLYGASNGEFPLLKLLDGSDLPYDAHSAFSISVNHRETFTGVTDNDRALTISRLGRDLENWISAGPAKARTDFGALFRTPGHVPICRARPGLLSTRQGHTELGLALMQMAGLSTVFVGCEMLSDDGGARSRADASDWAGEREIPFVEGADVISAWESKISLEA